MRRQLSPLHQPPAWADEYVGMPWREEGRERDGSDCWGGARIVAMDRFGYTLPLYDTVAWRRQRSEDLQEASNAELAEFVRCERMKGFEALWEAAKAPANEVLGGGKIVAGELILMRGAPLHIGIAVAPGWMLHLEEGTEMLCVPYDDLRWTRRVIGFYRWVGEERC